jgi:hypothetical protein
MTNFVRSPHRDEIIELLAAAPAGGVPVRAGLDPQGATQLGRLGIIGELNESEVAARDAGGAPARKSAVTGKTRLTEC